MIREFIRNPYTLSSMRAYLRGIWWLVGFLARYAGATAEVMFRRNFGLRYLPTLAIGSVLLLFLAMLTAGDTPLLALFSVLTGVLTVWHALIALRNRDDAHRHSHFSGESLPLWTRFGVSPLLVRSIGEPGLCFAIALSSVLVDPALGLWLTAAGVSLILKEAGGRLRLRQRTMDATDSRLESEQFAAAVNRRVRGGTETPGRAHPARLARPDNRPPRRTSS